MRRADTITQLQADARIYARCPTCDEDFPLKRALLFYADAPIPEVAQERLDTRRADLRARVTALGERRRRASEGATQKAIDVNVGMILERVAPVCEGFGSARHACRPLFDPIDYVVFDGMNASSGATRAVLFDGPALAPARERVQRSIQLALEAGNCEWRTVRMGKDGRIQTG